jgi:tetratricopeptide (TPR) repeat protein
VDRSPQLFAVLSALHASGYQADVAATAFHPVRARLRGELLRLRGPAVEAVRKYYREHLLADPAATLSRYVSFALVVGPPPQFEFQLPRESLPPDVLALEGFGEVLAEFYREARIETLYRRVQPEYDAEIARFQQPVAEIVLPVTSYLREVLKPAAGRTFSVLVEPLVGAKTSFRNYGLAYSIVVNPGDELPLEEIRHAYLHFLLDPLPLRYRRPVERLEPFLRIAARAPRLPHEYRNDFSELFTECFVRAVELRLRRLPAARVAPLLDEAEQEGYVLVRALYQQLEKFEAAEPAMSFFFPELVAGVDAAAEARRLQAVVFPPRLAPAPPVEAAAATESPLERALTQAERLIAAQDAPAAAAAFTRVLEEHPDLPRALYGLAVASAMQGEADRAKELFQKLVEQGSGAPPAERDARLLAWSHVYLGRIYDVEGQRELALTEYRAALAVERAPEAARQAAQRGLEKGYEPAATKREPGPARP